MPAKGMRPHYRGSYLVDARKVRQAAYADPSTVCPTCGMTLEQRRAITPNATWDAGHMMDAVPGSPLIAQCSYCNRSAGAHMANAKRRSGYDW